MKLPYIHPMRTGGRYIKGEKVLRVHPRLGHVVSVDTDRPITGLIPIGHCIPYSQLPPNITKQNMVEKEGVIWWHNSHSDPNVDDGGFFHANGVLSSSLLQDHLMPFATIRNPFSLLVSLAGFFGAPWSEYKKWIYVTKAQEKRPVYQHIKEGFSEYLRYIFSITRSYPSRSFLYPMLFDETGQMVVKYIVRQETLDKDLKKLAKLTGNEYKKCPPVGCKVYEPQDIWSLELIDLVYSVYSREMWLFGYAYEAHGDKLAIIGSGEVKDLDLVRYYRETDTLVVDGKEIKRETFPELE